MAYQNMPAMTAIRKSRDWCRRRSPSGSARREMTTTAMSRTIPPTLQHATRMLTILRWLGPWADASAMPRVRAVPGHTPVRHVRLWQEPPASGPAPTVASWPPRRGQAPKPTILLLPGMHFLGPDDPRFRRFAAVLAATGAEVIAPYLHDFLGLQLTPRLFEEARAALHFASEAAAGPVSVMSISFGSIAALHLAATCPERVSRVVVFGGYRNLQGAFRFALGAATAGFPAEVRDPLNGPAVLTNLADELLSEGERAAFRAATLAFSRRTWSRSAIPENKRDGRHLKVGAEIAETLSGEARALFRVACRLEGDPLALADQVFASARARTAFLDPSPLLSRVKAPVTCAHGRDDDVIPWTESEALARDLPNARAVITGLYGHTGRAHGSVPGVGAIAGELRALGRVVSALADLGRR